MKTPTYTPYDGSARLFTIGLAQLDPERWIEPDGMLEPYLAEKERVLGAHRSEVFLEEPESRDAQQEVLDLLCDHLATAHPDIYRREAATMHVAGRQVSLNDAAVPPLLTAGALVQDDLVIMRRRETGWHLVAGYVAFPSSWSLPDKFGRTMEEIHAPVPDFGAGTRNAGLISRMFDNLRPDRFVVRFNWSINPSAALYYPASKAEGALPADRALSLDETFARVERQTLRRLPVTGDILFTIRIYLDPLAAIATLANAEDVAAVFAEQLRELNAEQLAYKGLTESRNVLIDRLSAFTRA